MVVRDGAEIRRGRMNTLLTLIERRGEEITIKKLKGIFMLQTGLTSRKIDEYIADLIDVGLVENHEDHLHRVV